MPDTPRLRTAPDLPFLDSGIISASASWMVTGGSKIAAMDDFTQQPSSIMITLRASRLEKLVADRVEIVIEMFFILTQRSSQDPKLNAPDLVGHNVLTDGSTD
jgi:hypothetical protein